MVITVKCKEEDEMRYKIYSYLLPWLLKRPPPSPLEISGIIYNIAFTLYSSDAEDRLLIENDTDTRVTILLHELR